MGKRERVEDQFRNHLRRERQRRGWSQADLAKTLTENAVPMYATTIAKIEAGERSVRVDEAAAVADVLDVPLDWMLGRQTAGPASEIRYALRALKEKAQDTINHLGSMIQVLEDWEVDTSGIGFDGKAELDTDLQDIALLLAGVQSRLLTEVVLRDLPEDHPVWKTDVDQLRELFRQIRNSVTPLKPVNPENLEEIQSKDIVDEA